MLTGNTDHSIMMWLEEFSTLGVAFRNSLWIWLNSFLMNSTEWLKALKCLGLWSPAMEGARFSNNCQDACGDYCSQAYFEHTWIGSESPTISTLIRVPRMSSGEPWMCEPWSLWFDKTSISRNHSDIWRFLLFTGTSNRKGPNPTSFPS
jgi:hypothetical protein